ncbi:MAG: N-acetylmuramoyl-L-alanine amidase [Coprococcus sp.]
MWKKGISGLLWGLAIVMVYSVLFGRTISSCKTGVNKTVSVMAGEEAYFIVIDSGHGFFDAGKIGVSGALEKDINLAIALKLKADLESQGFHVRMTRENDVQLYDGMRPSDKKEDMQKRVSLMTDENCILAVSIHQNSFTEEKYRGAQVFYYGPSERSRGLAASIQQALIEFQDPDNTRQEKANEDYYLLRKETVPTVICECGFMSNAAEEALLKSEMYQEKTAWAISVGIVRYLNGSTEKGDIEHDR